MNKSNTTRSKSKKEFLPIKIEIESFFKKQDKQARIIYRTCSDKFDNEGPHNFLPKKIVPDRLVIFIDFNSEKISSNNINRIIAFTEKEGLDLSKKLPLKSRFGMNKIDLEKLPPKYIFKNILDLKQHYKDFN